MADRSPSDGHSRRQFLASMAATTSTLSIAGCLEFSPSTALIVDGPTVRLEHVTGGFTYPTDMVEVPDGSGRFFLTDQVGIIYSIDPADGTSRVVADLTDRVVDIYGSFSERGLLGIACHPNFDSNGRVFVRYSASAHPEEPSTWHTEVLTEFTTSDGTIDPASERELMRIPQPHVIHQGGSVLFGPDGYLYTTTGDGGDVFEGADPSWYDENPGRGAHSQTTTDNLLGAVLRIDVDNQSADHPYAIPEDNPLVDVDGHRDEYYAWGFRNPWGASFDGDDLYVADVGDALFECINLVEKGGNYGWNIREGTHCFDDEATVVPPETCPNTTPQEVRGGEELLGPVIEYPQYHPTDDPFTGAFDFDHQYGSAVIGGHVHRGSVPALDGGYVFGDWSAIPHGAPRGQLFIARPRDELDEVHDWFDQLDLWGIERLVIESNDDVASDGQLNRYVTSVAMDLEGELYALVTGTNEVTGETGEVRKLVHP